MRGMFLHLILKRAKDLIPMFLKYEILDFHHNIQEIKIDIFETSYEFFLNDIMSSDFFLGI